MGVGSEVSETDILRRAMNALVLQCPGARFWRQNSGRKGRVRFASRNLPDIMGYQRDGKILACEVKAHDGVLSLEQWEFLRDVRACGGMALLYAPIHENALEGFFALPVIPTKFLPKERR